MIQIFLVSSYAVTQESPIQDQVLHSFQSSPYFWWNCERSDNKEFKRKASCNPLVGQYGLFSLTPGLHNTLFSPYCCLLSARRKATGCHSAISFDGTENILNLSIGQLLMLSAPLFWRKTFSLVFVLVPGFVPHSSGTTVPSEHRRRVRRSCRTPVWELLAVQSSRGSRRYAD